MDVGINCGIVGTICEITNSQTDLNTWNTTYWNRRVYDAFCIVFIST